MVQNLLRPTNKSADNNGSFQNITKLSWIIFYSYNYCKKNR